MNDARRSSRAAQRNKDPLLAVLRRVLPGAGLVLEVASGTGEHAAFFAQALPTLTWQPSDCSEIARASIDAWRHASGLPNLSPPAELDASDECWPLGRADAVLCINMVHISPWSATLGLMRGAARLLAPGAPLILYGPFLEAGVAPAPSNLAFDGDLRQRNPQWGLRQLEEVTAVAASNGFALAEVVRMPANNLMVIFRRR